jgi:hypothetical protein
MVPDGRPAAKFAASLVLICLSVALAWSITPPRRGETAMREAHVTDRARPMVEHALERARANGDAARVQWLEGILRVQQAGQGDRERHNAGVRH